MNLVSPTCKLVECQNELLHWISSVVTSYIGMFQELLADAGLQRDSTLAAVEARLRTDPRFPDLPGGLETTRLFAEAMESRVPEFDFWDLLRGCQDPPLSKDVSWGRARRQVSF